jgi:ATP adenylyltransferase
MEKLWAPWRIRYILGPKESGCFLCTKPSESRDRENLVLVRDRTCYALLNTYPYNPGHLMIAPYKHTGEMDDLGESELADLMLLTRRCQQILRKAMKPEGFNIGINLGQCAGAGVPGHLHIHIVPRWNGDTNYMPVLGDTHVLPQALEELWDALRQHV